MDDAKEEDFGVAALLKNKSSSASKRAETFEVVVTPEDVFDGPKRDPSSPSSSNSFSIFFDAGTLPIPSKSPSLSASLSFSSDDSAGVATGVATGAGIGAGSGIGAGVGSGIDCCCSCSRSCCFSGSFLVRGAALGEEEAPNEKRSSSSPKRNCVTLDLVFEAADVLIA